MRPFRRTPGRIKSSLNTLHLALVHLGTNLFSPLHEQTPLHPLTSPLSQLSTRTPPLARPCHDWPPPCHPLVDPRLQTSSLPNIVSGSLPMNHRHRTTSPRNQEENTATARTMPRWCQDMSMAAADAHHVPVHPDPLSPSLQRQSTRHDHRNSPVTATCTPMPYIDDATARLPSTVRVDAGKRCSIKTSPRSAVTSLSSAIPFCTVLRLAPCP